METGYQNKMLRIAALLMLVFSIAAAAVGCYNTGKTIVEMNRMSGSDLAQIDAYAQSETEGMLGGQDVVGFVGVLSYVAMAIVCAGNLGRAVVGFCGLSRANKPEKHGFFTIWGIVFVIIGLFGLGGLGSLYGVVNTLGGLVPAVLFLIGAGQLKKERAAQPVQVVQPVAQTTESDPTDTPE